MLIINSNLAVDNRMVDISDAQQIRNSSNLYIGISLMNNFFNVDDRDREIRS